MKMRKILTYGVADIVPYINWIYFFYAWGMNGKKGTEKDKLLKDAHSLLEEWSGHRHTHAVFGLFEANSDGDDLLLDNKRIPLLRQQRPARPGEPNLCLSDFVRPLSSGIADTVGLFAATVDAGMEKAGKDDPYKSMLAQTLADRLAEGTAERMHEEVRRVYWGYAPDEKLSMEDTHQERYQGIRPAVGYPSLPDTSLNFLLDDLIGMKDIGIRLTESGMMQPHASVSGFMFAHPKARYFSVGPVGDDQLRDYARRRGVPVEVMRKWLMVD